MSKVVSEKWSKGMVFSSKEMPCASLGESACNKHESFFFNMTQRLTVLLNLLSKMTFFFSYDRLRKHPQLNC